MNLVVAATVSPVVSPLLLILLCAVAGIGTVLLLPSRQEKAQRKIGGAIVLTAAIIFASTLIRLAAGQHDPMGCYFWVFSAIALFASLRVVTHNRPVYSALYFVLTVFASAGLFVLLSADFMAGALLLIYAGAILVTYVFVIMLAAKAGVGGELTEADTQSREPVLAAAVGFGLMSLLLFVIFDKAPEASATLVTTSAQVDVSVNALARYLFVNQLVNLELAGVLLTLAMVGAIVIARRRMWNPDRPGTGNEAFEIGEDNPLSIEVEGTTNPRQKAYPES